MRIWNIRFIPVYTGNTGSCSSTMGFFAVYPCVYREHKWPKGQHEQNTGLSLCVQGTPFTSATAFNCRRFIPVYTGNTGSCSSTMGFFAVYPCVYREHKWPKGQHEQNTGLSLCVQGTPFTSATAFNCRRFIPVCTGNTICSIFVWL